MLTKTDTVLVSFGVSMAAFIVVYPLTVVTFTVFLGMSFFWISMSSLTFVGFVFFTVLHLFMEERRENVTRLQDMAVEMLYSFPPLEEDQHIAKAAFSRKEAAQKADYICKKYERYKKVIDMSPTNV